MLTWAQTFLCIYNTIPTNKRLYVLKVAGRCPLIWRLPNLRQNSEVNTDCKSNSIQFGRRYPVLWKKESGKERCSNVFITKCLWHDQYLFAKHTHFRPTGTSSRRKFVMAWCATKHEPSVIIWPKRRLGWNYHTNSHTHAQTYTYTHTYTRAYTNIPKNTHISA